MQVWVIAICYLVFYIKKRANLKNHWIFTESVLLSQILLEIRTFLRGPKKIQEKSIIYLAEKTFQEVKKIADSIGNTYLSFYNLLDTARLYLRKGLYSRVKDLLESMEGVVEKTGSLRLRDDYLYIKTEYLIRTGMLNQAEKLLKKVNSKDFHHKMLKAEIMLKKGYPERALSMLDAVEIQELPDFYRMEVNTIRARILLTLGKARDALDLLGRVKEFYERIGAGSRAREVEKLMEEAV